jgi:predicted O-methyltransferase YrrM
MLRMIYGAVTTRLIAVVAELGIADLVSQAPRPVSELAEATSTNPDALHRILRTLAGVGVFTEVSARRFGQTPLSATLRTGASGSIRDAVLELGSAQTFGSLEGLMHTVRTGQPAFEQAYGTDWWTYLGQRPRRAEVFNNAQNITARQVHALVLEPYDLRGARRLVDIGGGHGTLVAAMLGRYPDLCGVVFDRPAVVAGAQKVLDAANVAERAEVIGGDFFDKVPAGGDVYLLSMILHDWDDQRAVAILANVREAMAPGARVLVIDAVIPQGDTPSVGKFVDIYMLVHFAGRERTEEEFAALFDAAGLRLVETRHSRAPTSLIVATAKSVVPEHK